MFSFFPYRRGSRFLRSCHRFSLAFSCFYFRSIPLLLISILPLDFVVSSIVLVFFLLSAICVPVLSVFLLFSRVLMLLPVCFSPEFPRCSSPSFLSPFYLLSYLQVLLDSSHFASPYQRSHLLFPSPLFSIVSSSNPPTVASDILLSLHASATLTPLAPCSSTPPTLNLFFTPRSKISPQACAFTYSRTQLFTLARRHLLQPASAALPPACIGLRAPLLKTGSSGTATFRL